ncbi:MAG: hypothetical protein ACLUVC_00010 [Longibaculum sp.]
MEYSYYFEEFKGKLDETIFKEIEPKAYDVLEMYIMGFLPMGTDLTKLNINKALCYQIDFMDNIGLGVINGDRSEHDIKSVSTSGFNYTYDDSQKYDFIGNIPISSMASELIKQELRIKGYLNRIYNQCRDHRDF